MSHAHGQLDYPQMQVSPMIFPTSSHLLWNNLEKDYYRSSSQGAELNTPRECTFTEVLD